MARQLGNNGPDHSVRRHSVYGPRTVQEAAARRLSGPEHEAATILGRCTGRYDIADTDLSPGSGASANGGYGTGFGLWQLAKGVFAYVGGGGAEDVVPGLLADTAGRDSVRGDVVLHLRHAEAGVHG